MPAVIPEGDVPRPGLAEELSEQNRRCYEHYLRCRAVNWNVPDSLDPLVQRHAAIIRAVEDEAGEARAALQLTAAAERMKDRARRK